MNRIDQRFTQRKLAGEKAFVAYITAGDPDLQATGAFAESFDRLGVDVLELGVPFSDPLADGTVNQLAAARALASGTHLKGILKLSSHLRRRGVNIPLVLFTYFNPIHRYGTERFIKDASRAGIDGILNLDLPYEEADEYLHFMKQHGLHSIPLIAPTTSSKRIRSIAKSSSGFIYYVSREGVTGMQKRISTGLDQKIKEIRKHTQTPIVIGFGISTPEQVKTTCQFADGCVVGSAIVHQIGLHGKKADLTKRVSRIVRNLISPLRKK